MRDFVCILCGSGGSLRCGRLIGEIAIQKCMPQSYAWAAFSLSSAVIGHKKAQILIEHQMQIAVEVTRVAGVADDSMAIACLFIKAEAHRIHGWQIFKRA